jgi:hypothetical protein
MKSKICVNSNARSKHVLFRFAYIGKIIKRGTAQIILTGTWNAVRKQ